jgi:hypothetical protein
MERLAVIGSTGHNPLAAGSLSHPFYLTSTPKTFRLSFMVTIPQSYAEILTLAKRATCLDWYAIHRELSLTLDEKDIDRRFCLTIRLERGTVEMQTLSGFDPKANRWSQYCAPKGYFELPDKRGQRALVDFIKTLALKENKYIPNPSTLHLYNIGK